ncbi:O-antigen ligase family protein [Dactylosporangium sp. CA-233914]|uniref:O-antigen ligase family protein n=1 Tax=Dactylosporangium sp. CA-233914 TaxID=3239934 RepID=UPI003D933817
MDSPALQAIPARSESVGGWPAPTLALLAAVTAGVVAQGGFYLPGRILVSALALVALGLTLARNRRLDRDLRWLAIATAAIAGWALVRAATAGGFTTAAGIVLALATLLAGVVAGRRARPRDLAAGLAGLGALVAITAWAGVAWRVERWSVLVESTLWRGASTLTYPNAAAAVLAAAGLIALALLLAEPGSLVWAVMLYAILAGLAATLSRAGWLAFAAGVLCLAFLASVRPVLRHLLPALVGAAIALAALVPSFPADASPRPLLAAGGLVFGGLLAVLLPKLHGGALAAAWTLLGAGAAAALAVTATRPMPSTVDAVLNRRFTLASQGRSGSLRSALEQAGAHPLLGTGPGRARYFWFDVHGTLVVSRWVHNEYLQWLVDLGAVGLAALAALGVAAVVLLWRGRGTNPLWAGAVAAIAALAVHSAFDFLWELAVVPLLFGVLAGMAAPRPSEESAPSTNGEESQ